MRRTARSPGDGVSTPSGEHIRLAEVVASLSLATDLGNGQPAETALQCTLVAMRLADLAGIKSGPDREAVFWGGLLRFVGCVSTSLEESQFGGDDIALRSGLLATDFGNPTELEARVSSGLRQSLDADGARSRTEAFLREGPQLAPTVLTSHCEVAARLATRLGMPAHVRDAARALHERWDGNGPYGMRGEAIPLAARILKVAEVALVHARTLDPGEPERSLRDRGGADLDEALAVTSAAAARELLSGIAERSVWDEVLAYEPRPWRRVAPNDRADLGHVLGDYSDLKSAFTLGHARGVAELACQAARGLGLAPERVANLQMAALLHDLGRASVPNGILDSPLPLSAVDRERALRHSYESERVLSFVPALAHVARLAGQAHERLDGSGYHRGLGGASLTPEARILAAANAYRALVEGRAYRAALASDGAGKRLWDGVRSGEFDGQAVEAVLHAAGDRTGANARALPAGLTHREVEVLRLLARGLTNPQIGESLTISPRTAQQHIRHIYDKIDVSTRAAATLFVAEHDLFNTWA